MISAEPTVPSASAFALPFTPAVFVALSSGLTGISPAQLQPARDPIDIAGQFYAALRTRVSASALHRVADIFLSAPTPEEGACAVLDDPAVGAIGRSILKLWLLGTWHDPAAPDIAVEVVPTQVYKESLVWRVMQGHPMSEGAFSFSRWARPTASGAVATASAAATA